MFRNLSRVEHTIRGRWRNPHHHPEPVHLLDHGNAERCELAAQLVDAAAVAELIAAVVCELHPASPEPEELTEQREAAVRRENRFRIGLDRSSALEIEEELQFSRVGPRWDVGLGADDGSLSVRPLDIAEDHVERAHRAFEHCLIAVALFERIAAGREDDDTLAGLNLARQDE